MTLKGTPFEDQLRIARQAGFQGIRVRGNDVKAYLAARAGASDADVGRLVREAGLVTPGFVTEAEVYEWHLRSLDDVDLAAAVEGTCKTAVSLGATLLVVPVMQAQGDLVTTMRNFRVLCDRAAQYGLDVGLECIGHIPKVADVETAWRVVETADRPNGGLVIDVFQFHRGGSTLASLERVPADRVLMVDLDDAMDLPRTELLGYKHRLYPGEGIAPVDDVLRVLSSAGYSGPYAVELFNEAYWAADPREVAARSFASARAAIDRALAAARAQLGA